MRSMQRRGNEIGMIVKFIQRDVYANSTSDISPNWKDGRTRFGYTTLYEIRLGDSTTEGRFKSIERFTV